MTQTPSPFLARVWRISGSSYPDDETFSAILHGTIPQIEKLPGYLGGYFLVERDRETILRISFWDTLEHLQAADVMARNAVTGMMVVTAGDSISVDVCDVLLSDPPPAVRPGGGE